MIEEAAHADSDDEKFKHEVIEVLLPDGNTMNIRYVSWPLFVLMHCFVWLWAPFGSACDSFCTHVCRTAAASLFLRSNAQAVQAKRMPLIRIFDSDNAMLLQFSASRCGSRTRAWNVAAQIAVKLWPYQPRNICLPIYLTKY